MTGQSYPPVNRLNSQAGLQSDITRVGYVPRDRGRCTNVLDLIGEGARNHWCELLAGHSGAHQEGTAQWMRKDVEPQPGGLNVTREESDAFHEALDTQRGPKQHDREVAAEALRDAARDIWAAEDAQWLRARADLIEAGEVDL